MKIMLQVAIIFTICLFGEGISSILPINMPGSVVSMILLFLLLLSKVVKEENIKETADFFLKNMAFFFIPAGVAIMEYFDLIKDKIFAFLLVCIITTVLTFAATAWTVIGVIRLQKTFTNKKQKNIERNQ